MYIELCGHVPNPGSQGVMWLWQYLSDGEQGENGLENEPEQDDAKDLRVPERLKGRKLKREALETGILLPAENEQWQHSHRQQKHQEEHTWKTRGNGSM